MVNVRKVVEATAHDGEAISALCRLVLDKTTEARRAMYAAWVLTHLSPADKQQFVAPYVSTQFRAYHHFKALFQCLKWDMLKFRCFI